MTDKVIITRFSFTETEWSEAREHLSEKEIRDLLFAGGLGYLNTRIGEKQAIEHQDILEDRDD